MKTSRAQTQQPDKATQTHRQVLIRDAILGMIRRYPQDGVFLLPTLDMLALYFQAPVMLTFWVFDGRSPHCLLSNIENPLLMRGDNPEFPPHQTPAYTSKCQDHPKRIRNVLFLPCNDKRIVALVIQTRHDAPQLATDFSKQLLNLFGENSFWGEFREHLTKGLDSAPKRWTDLIEAHRISHTEALLRANRLTGCVTLVAEKKPSKPTPSLFGDFDARAYYFQEFERAINDVLLSKSDFKHLNHPGPSGDGKFPNLHFCVSSALSTNTWRADEFPFTAHLLLTTQQQQVFDQYLRDSNAQEVMDKLQSPDENAMHGNSDPRTKNRHYIMALAQSRDSSVLLNHLSTPLLGDSTASADSPFVSGSVSFGDSPGESLDNAKTSGDLQRHFAEKVLYGICRPKDGGKHIFHIPIHVNGVVWINAFSFTEDKPVADPKAWRHNYLLYRDIITEIGSLIRNAAKNLYLQVIDEVVRRCWTSHVGDAPTAVHALNCQLFSLALSVPFPWLTFAAKASAQCNQVVPQRRSEQMFIGACQNPFFVQTVPFQLLELDEVIQCVEQSAQRAIDEYTIEQSRCIANTAHILGRGIARIRESLRECSGTGVEKIRSKIRKMELLANTVRSLVTGRGTLGETGGDADAIAVIHGEAAEAALGDSPLTLKLSTKLEASGHNKVQYSKAYLLVVCELCFNNIKDHAADPSGDICFFYKDAELWATFDSKMLPSKAASINLPAMNSGSFSSVGVNTIHAVTLGYFGCRPTFEVIDSNIFRIHIPIASRL